MKGESRRFRFLCQVSTEQITAIKLRNSAKAIRKMRKTLQTLIISVKEFNTAEKSAGALAETEIVHDLATQPDSQRTQ